MGSCHFDTSPENHSLTEIALTHSKNIGQVFEPHTTVLTPGLCIGLKKVPSPSLNLLLQFFSSDSWRFILHPQVCQ